MKQEKTTTILYRIALALLFALLLFLSTYKLTAKYVDPWDEARHGWARSMGTYTLNVGASVEDIRGKVDVNILTERAKN